MRVSVNWLMENATFNDQFNKSLEEMWEMKFQELSDAFIESVSSIGVQAAIVYIPSTETVYNGHHRILAAWLLNQEFIEYVDSFVDCPEEYMVKEGLPESRKERMYE